VPDRIGRCLALVEELAVVLCTYDAHLATSYRRKHDAPTAQAIRCSFVSSRIAVLLPLGALVLSFSGHNISPAAFVGQRTLFPFSSHGQQNTFPSRSSHIAFVLTRP